MRADRAARAYDPRIVQVRAGYLTKYGRILVDRLGRHFRLRHAAAGALQRLLIAKDRLRISPVAAPAAAAASESTTSIPRRHRKISRKEAVRQAIMQLDARPLPPARWKSCSAPAGPACCCTKLSATDSKQTSIAKAPLRSPVSLASRVASEKVHGGGQRPHAHPPRLAQCR